MFHITNINDIINRGNMSMQEIITHIISKEREHISKPKRSRTHTGHLADGLYYTQACDPWGITINTYVQHVDRAKPQTGNDKYYQTENH